tara:strand:- start:62 stop:565 length:504 start_codon:yes stop_codon:yes gene_type:complete
MAAISMFFASLLSAFIVEKADIGNWNKFILPNYFVISTVVIILSSILLFFVRPRLRRKQSVFFLVISVLLLGVIFSFLQIRGWQALINQGIYLTGIGSNISGSFLYVVTLTHLLHLFGGLVALVISTVKSKRNLYTIENYLGLELTSIYWHFLTIIWIILFCFLKFY